MSLDLPYNAIIPYHVQCCDALSDAAKIYFGQIAGLSRKSGYIWATDEQLAEMKQTSIRNIQRWNKELEDQGFISRETKNYPAKQEDGSFSWEKKRKIFVNEAFSRELKPKPVTPAKTAETTQDDNSNISYGTAKNGGSIGTAKNGGSIGTAKNGGIINTSSTYASLKQQEASASLRPVVVPSSLEKLEIPDSMRFKIANAHSAEEINLAVERCLRWKSRPSDEVGIMTTLQRSDTWQDNPTPEETAMSNLDHLKMLSKLDRTRIGMTDIVVGHKYIEFVSGMTVKTFTIEDISFKKDVTEYLEILNQHANRGKNV